MFSVASSGFHWFCCAVEQTCSVDNILWQAGDGIIDQRQRNVYRRLIEQRMEVHGSLNKEKVNKLKKSLCQFEECLRFHIGSTNGYEGEGLKMKFETEC